MRISPKFFTFVVFVSITAACTKSGPPPDPGPGPDEHEDAAGNEWIYNTMVKYYLYNDKAKAMSDPDYDQSSETFFESLLSDDPNDNDGKHTGGKSYFYSYMERLNGTKLEAASYQTYGIEYILYSFTNAGGYGARVLYVAKGSVAETAGIERGDWILKIGSENLSMENHTRLETGSGVTLGVASGRANGNTLEMYNSRTVTLPAATVVDNSPVYLDTVYDKGAQKIAYLVYNAFETGDNYKYDNQLKEAFRRFRAKGATDLVLDLRYNLGGYFSCAQLLASMIVRQAELGKPFVKYTYNSEPKSTVEYPASHNFLPAANVSGENLGLERLYVLTGEWTASSSELVINALRSYIDVRLFGGKTEGKNVGSVNYRSSGHKLSLQPIIVRVANADGESDYQHGFTPESGLNDELDNIDQMKPLGEESEYLLSMALDAITGNSAGYAAGRMTRSAGAAGWTPTRIGSLAERPVKGLIMYTVDL